MKKIKAKTILAFFVAICFLATYFLHKDNMDFILACAWLCIGIALHTDTSKKVTTKENLRKEKNL